MNAIVNFFEGIGDAIVSAFGFLVSLVEDLVYFISVLGWAVAQIPTLLGWIPASLLTILTILITVVIVCRVIGRG